MTWFHFDCFASFLQQIRPNDSLVKLHFEVLFHPHTPLWVDVFDLAHRALRSPSWACVKCPHWTMLMCLAISFVLMTTWVEWQSTSRSHCWSTPPHPWSLCNGPKSWDNVWRPTFPSHVLACCNLSLGLATKTRGCKVMGQVGDPGVTSHAPRSVKSVRELTLTLSSELPWWELESQMDSQNFREQFQGSKLNGLWRSLYHWKALRT